GREIGVDALIADRRGSVGEVVAAGEDEGVGPVVAVIDEAAAGGASAKGDVGGIGVGSEERGKLRANKGDFLRVAVGDGGAMPAVVAEAGGLGLGVMLQQKEVGGHVAGGGIGAVGEEVELHG